MSFSFELTGAPAFLVALVFFALFFYLFVYLPVSLAVKVLARVRRKTDRINQLRQHTIIPEYAPPLNLAPAEIGYLFDSTLGIAEVYATIASLSQRGLITITEENGVLVVNHIELVPQGTSDFDKSIMLALAEYKSKPLTKHALKKIAGQTNKVIKKQLQTQGYVVGNKEQYTRTAWRLGFTMLVLFLLFPILAFRPTTIGGIFVSVVFFIVFLPGYLIFSMLLYGVYAKIAGEPWLATDKVKQVWPDIEGYRHYIQVVDADNIAFDSKTAQGISANTVLPYAIALGFNTGWLKKVAGS